MTFPESKAMSPYFRRKLGWGRRDLGSSFYCEIGGEHSEMVTGPWQLGGSDSKETESLGESMEWGTFHPKTEHAVRAERSLK